MDGGLAEPIGSFHWTYAALTSKRLRSFYIFAFYIYFDMNVEDF